MGDDVDILIVGGGIVGAVLMHALKPLGFRVCLVDERTPLSVHDDAIFDARSLALAPASITILEQLAVWPLLQDHATSIDTIHVSEQGALGQVRLQKSASYPLGAVVEMAFLMRVLDGLLDVTQRFAPAKLAAFDVASNRAIITTVSGDVVLKPRLVIGADGTSSFLRQCCQLGVHKKNYNQHALVANIGLARAHQHDAYERFTPEGPMALLPMTNQRVSLVWVQSPEKTQHVMALDDDVFLRTLQRAFGYRLGRFVRVGKRMIYPLSQTIMPQHVTHSVVFIGNAAHTLHPVAGQGFNLGLRDVAMLVQCLAQHGLGSDALARYQQARRQDETFMKHFTDGLVTLFGSQFPGVGFARRLGLTLVDNSTVLKNMVSRYASGYGGMVPDLACGIPVSL